MCKSAFAHGDPLFLNLIFTYFLIMNNSGKFKEFSSTSFYCIIPPLNSRMASVNSRTFSRVTIKRACIQIETFHVLLKTPIFLRDSKLSLISQHYLLNNKMPGSYTAADSPLTSSIYLKCQSRQVHLFSLYLYNNAATIYFCHRS